MFNWSPESEDVWPLVNSECDRVKLTWLFLPWVVYSRSAVVPELWSGSCRRPYVLNVGSRWDPRIPGHLTFYQ